jgi:hypothetical protein
MNSRDGHITAPVTDRFGDDLYPSAIASELAVVRPINGGRPPALVEAQPSTRSKSGVSAR